MVFACFDCCAVWVYLVLVCVDDLFDCLRGFWLGCACLWCSVACYMFAFIGICCDFGLVSRVVLTGVIVGLVIVCFWFLGFRRGDSLWARDFFGLVY